MEFTMLVLGIFFGIALHWYYRWSVRGTRYAELTDVTERLSTRMQRWQLYWTAILENRKSVSAQEAMEVSKETFQAFDDVISVVRKML